MLRCRGTELGVAIKADGWFAGRGGIGCKGGIASGSGGLDLAIGGGGVWSGSDGLTIVQGEITGAESFHKVLGDSENGRAIASFGAKEILSVAPGAVVKGDDAVDCGKRKDESGKKRKEFHGEGRGCTYADPGLKGEAKK